MFYFNIIYYCFWFLNNYFSNIKLTSNGSCNHRESNASRLPVSKLACICIVGTSFGEFGWTKKLSFVVFVGLKGVFQRPLKYIALTKTKIVEADSKSEIRFALSEVHCSDLEMCTLLRTVIFLYLETRGFELYRAFHLQPMSLSH